METRTAALSFLVLLHLFYTTSGMSCVTPAQPKNGQWKYFNNENKSPKSYEQVTPDTQLLFTCHDNSALSTVHDREKDIISCGEDGQWSTSPFPDCQKLCKKYFSRNRAILRCELDGSVIPCDRAIHGTQLTYKCEPYYEPESDHGIDVCNNGSWRYSEPKCKEICGKKQVSALPVIVQGVDVQRGDHPWVVALYSNGGNVNKSHFTNICSGSLLSSSIVLTAAHCVTNRETGESYPLEFFRVAAGKYSNIYMDEKDIDTAQYRQVMTTKKHADYRGKKLYFMFDIALIKLSASFVLSEAIQPICYTKRPLLQNEGTATFTSWGSTTSEGTPSKVLKEIDLEYIETDKCYTELDPNFASRNLVSERFCARFVNRSKGLCRGDGGGSLVVREEKSDRYFVRGIANIIPVTPVSPGSLAIWNDCDIESIVLFTNVTLYADWIAHQVKLLED